MLTTFFGSPQTKADAKPEQPAEEQAQPMEVEVQDIDMASPAPAAEGEAQAAQQENVAPDEPAAKVLLSLLERCHWSNESPSAC